MQIVHRVIVERARPLMPPDVPSPVARLAQDCWGRSPDGRPSFEQVAARLQAMLAQLEREGRLPAAAARAGAGAASTSGGWRPSLGLLGSLGVVAVLLEGEEHVTDF
jgi:hypothetical protein